MNKKVATIIIVIACVIVTVVLAMGYMIKEGIIDTENIFNNTEENSNSSQSVKEDNMPERAYFREGAECTLRGGENVKLYFKYNSTKISKKVEDFDKLSFNFEEKVDSNGTITNDYSYVICNITVKNVGTESFLTTINNVLLFPNGIDSEYTEVRSFDSHLKNTTRTDYYYVNFKPNEEHNYNIVFVEKDSIIKKYKNKFLLYALFNGSEPQPSDPIIEKKEK